jgi:hypothetical protein
MGTYVYCIARAHPFEEARASFQAPAIMGAEHPVRLLCYRDLVAIVSDAPTRRMGITREHLLTHEGVVLEAMQRSEVIPLSFGTIARNDKALIERLLQAAYPELLEQLKALQGSVELDLKVLWHQERLYEEIVVENERIRALRPGIEQAPLQERIELGQLTSEAIATKSDEEAQMVLEALGPLVLEAQPGRMLNDTMVLNGAFLMERPQQEAFECKVTELADSQEGRLIFRLVGPVPPYHFVDAHVQWEEAANGPD